MADQKKPLRTLAGFTTTVDELRQLELDLDQIQSSAKPYTPYIPEDKQQDDKFQRWNNLFRFENYYTISKLFEIIKQREEDPNYQVLEELGKFLANRWNLIKNTNLAYCFNTACTANRLCMKVAMFLENASEKQVNRYLLLMPTITDQGMEDPSSSSLMSITDNDFSLAGIILTHDNTGIVDIFTRLVLLDQTRSLNGSADITSTKPKYQLTPFEEGIIKNRHLAATTTYAQMMIDQYDWKHAKTKKTLYSILEQFRQQLQKSDAYYGKGKKEDADGDIYYALPHFQNALDQLTTTQKDLLFNAKTSGTSGETFKDIWDNLTRKNTLTQKAVNTIETCTANAREAISQILNANRDILMKTELDGEKIDEEVHAMAFGAEFKKAEKELKKGFKSDVIAIQPYGDHGDYLLMQNLIENIRQAREIFDQCYCYQAPEHDTLTPNETLFLKDFRNHDLKQCFIICINTDDAKELTTIAVKIMERPSKAKLLTPREQINLLSPQAIQLMLSDLMKNCSESNLSTFFYTMRCIWDIKTTEYFHSIIFSNFEFLNSYTTSLLSFPKNKDCSSAIVRFGQIIKEQSVLFMQIMKEHPDYFSRIFEKASTDQEITELMDIILAGDLETIKKFDQLAETAKLPADQRDVGVCQIRLLIDITAEKFLALCVQPKRGNLLLRVVALQWLYQEILKKPNVFAHNFLAASTVIYAMLNQELNQRLMPEKQEQYLQLIDQQKLVTILKSKNSKELSDLLIKSERIWQVIVDDMLAGNPTLTIDNTLAAQVIKQYGIKKLLEVLKSKLDSVLQNFLVRLVPENRELLFKMMLTHNITNPITADGLLTIFGQNPIDDDGLLIITNQILSVSSTALLFSDQQKLQLLEKIGFPYCLKVFCWSIYTHASLLIHITSILKNVQQLTQFLSEFIAILDRSLTDKRKWDRRSLELAYALLVTILLDGKFSGKIPSLLGKIGIEHLVKSSTYIRGPHSTTQLLQALTSQERCTFSEQAVAYFLTLDYNIEDQDFIKPDQLLNEELFAQSLSVKSQIMLLRTFRLKSLLITNSKVNNDTSRIVHLFYNLNPEVQQQFIIGVTGLGSYTFFLCTLIALRNLSNRNTDISSFLQQIINKNLNFKKDFFSNTVRAISDPAYHDLLIEIPLFSILFLLTDNYQAKEIVTKTLALLCESHPPNFPKHFPEQLKTLISAQDRLIALSKLGMANFLAISKNMSPSIEEVVADAIDQNPEKAPYLLRAIININNVNDLSLAIKASLYSLVINWFRLAPINYQQVLTSISQLDDTARNLLLSAKVGTDGQIHFVSTMIFSFWLIKDPCIETLNKTLPHLTTPEAKHAFFKYIPSNVLVTVFGNLKNFITLYKSCQPETKSFLTSPEVMTVGLATGLVNSLEDMFKLSLCVKSNHKTFLADVNSQETFLDQYRSILKPELLKNKNKIKLLNNIRTQLLPETATYFDEILAANPSSTSNTNPHLQLQPGLHQTAAGLSH
jgi:hypothetical protein